MRPSDSANSVARLRWALSRGMKWSTTVTAAAAMAGALDALRFARDRGCDWNTSATREAAAGGHLSVLNYLLECGCSIGPDAATAAAEGGHLEVLERLERVPVGSDGRDLRWDWGTCAAAAANERVECLEYLLNAGCPFNANCPAAAVTRASDTPEGAAKTATMLRMFETRGCPVGPSLVFNLALHGTLDAFRAALDAGYPRDVTAWYGAVQRRCITRLVLLRDVGCPWDESVCTIATLGDQAKQMEVLEWLRANGAPFEEEACALAAANAPLALLKWLRANGAPWDATTCEGAAEAGRLDVLIWARENGAHWDERTCAAAARFGRLDVLMYAREKNCPWDDRVLAFAHDEGHQMIGAWAIANRCPGWEMYVTMFVESLART